MGKRSRKRAAPARPDERPRPSRSEAKNAAVRAQLEPLDEGERPLAVTIGALVALVLGLANVILYLAGLEVGGQKPTAGAVAGPTLIMLVAAWGMWRKKYWAVLGVEALLALIILMFSVLVVRAENVKSVAIAVAIIIPSGTLFWFLIRAMARIQMPRRPG